MSFVVAMNEQIHILSQQLHKFNAAKEVCQQIKLDKVDLSNLDPDHYQKLLEETTKKDPSGVWKTAGKGTFQERVPADPHPMRRFFGRMMDYFLCYAFIFVFFYLAVMNQWFSLVVTLMILVIGVEVAILLMVPIEALMLHIFGTTIGKILMGIRVEYYQGGRLYYSEALIRSWMVFSRGMGLGRPWLMRARLYHSFIEHHDEPQMSWDSECEVKYLRFGALNITAYVAVILVVAILVIKIW